MTVRIYQSLFRSDPPAFVSQLDSNEVGWRQVRSDMGGDLQGSFMLKGKINVLFGFFQSWLGYHVVSDNGGPWEGYVNELTLSHKGITRSISLNGVYNFVRGRYTSALYNPSFERTGPGAPETLLHWNETGTGFMTVTQGGFAVDGDFSAGLQRDAGGTCFIAQSVPLVDGAEETYELTFYTSGDGTNAGFYEVWDVTNGAAIVPLTTTGVTSSLSWQKVTVPAFSMLATSGCLELEIRFYPPTAVGGLCYFDDVRLQPPENRDLHTDWFYDLQSIAQFGQREQIVDLGPNPKAQADLLAQAALLQLAMPQMTTPQVSSNSDEETSLEVHCTGYWATAFFGFIPFNTDSFEQTIFKSDFIKWAIAYLPYIKLGGVSTNEEITYIEGKDRLRIGEALGLLVQQGNSDSAWRLVVENGRYLHYEPISLIPTYYRRGNSYTRSPISGEQPLNGFQLQPGRVVRDADFPYSPMTAQGVTRSLTDFVVTEWDVSADGTIRPSTRRN